MARAALAGLALTVIGAIATIYLNGRQWLRGYEHMGHWWMAALAAGLITAALPVAVLVALYRSADAVPIRERFRLPALAVLIFTAIVGLTPTAIWLYRTVLPADSTVLGPNTSLWTLYNLMALLNSVNGFVFVPVLWVLYRGASAGPQVQPRRELKIAAGAAAIFGLVVIGVLIIRLPFLVYLLPLMQQASPRLGRPVPSLASVLADGVQTLIDQFGYWAAPILIWWSLRRS